jgi:ABC-type amino acid transport substrate-binding protein
MSKLLKAIKDAEVDVISSVYEYSSNWNDFKLTQPYWDSSIAVISHDGKKFDQLRQLQGKTLAVNTNSSHRQLVVTGNICLKC